MMVTNIILEVGELQIFLLLNVTSLTLRMMLTTMMMKPTCSYDLQAQLNFPMFQSFQCKGTARSVFGFCLLEIQAL